MTARGNEYTRREASSQQDEQLYRNVINIIRNAPALYIYVYLVLCYRYTVHVLTRGFPYNSVIEKAFPRSSARIETHRRPSPAETRFLES